MDKESQAFMLRTLQRYAGMRNACDDGDDNDGVPDVDDDWPLDVQSGPKWFRWGRERRCMMILMVSVQKE